MGWLFVPGLADWNSDSESPSVMTTAVSYTSSAKATLQPPSWRGWRTRPWIRLLSGTISPPSMASLGVASWISCLQGFRVSPGQVQANDLASKTNAGSGRTLLASFAKLDPSGSFWKTSGGLFEGELSMYSETWPHRGSMRNGTVFRRPKLARHIFASGFTSWPTPTSQDAAASGAAAYPATATRHTGTTLTDARVRQFWTTPTGDDVGGRSTQYAQGGTALGVQAHYWATPNTQDISDYHPLESNGRTPQGHGANLKDHANSWATPQAADCEYGGGPNQTCLTNQIENWPTPRANVQRSSKRSLIEEAHWTAPALEQAAELAMG